MNWAEFDEVSLQYQDRFGECLPTEQMALKDFENAVAIMRACLANGKPYELPEKTQRLIDQGAKF